MLMLLLLTILVIMPVAVGYIIYKVDGDGFDPVPVYTPKVTVGDRIVYRKTKFSTQPPARAHHVSASAKGENYVYLIDKYWVVADVLENGVLVAQTRRGKLNQVRPDDPNFRKAGLLESLLHPKRFPVLAQAA
jgi:hypothetical protein